MSRLLLVLAILLALGGCATLRTTYQRLTSDEAVPSWDCGDPPGGGVGANDVGQSGGTADGEQ